MRIQLHATGHTHAPDGTLVRVDIMAGRWVATHFDGRGDVREAFYGTDQETHERAWQWTQGGK
jgi:hypothetical protein